MAIIKLLFLLNILVPSVADAIPDRLLVRPNIIRQPSFEELFNKRKDKFEERMKEETGEDYNIIKSDPIYILFEVEAMREMAKRSEDNYKISQCFLAFAEDDALDALTVIKRLDVDGVKESDEDYRVRLFNADDGISTAGSPVGYAYQATEGVDYTAAEEEEGVKRDNIVDVYPYRSSETVVTQDGEVFPKIIIVIVPNFKIDQGIKDKIRIKVESHLTSDKARPVADWVGVNLVKVRHLVVKEVEIFVRSSINEAQVREKIKIEMAEYRKSLYKSSENFEVDALISQFYVSGVKNVDIKEIIEIVDDKEEPFDIEDILVSKGQAVYIEVDKKAITVIEKVRGPIVMGGNDGERV